MQEAPITKVMIPLPERMGLASNPIERALEALDHSIRVSIPGIIQSYDAEKQTATVRIAIKERVTLNGEAWRDVQIKDLPDVPVLFTGGGDYYITFPIKAEDECLLVFADCCIDAWWQNGGVQAQMERRRHDLSDAFAIVGPFSQKSKTLSNVSEDSVQLRNRDGQVFLEVKDGEVTLSEADVKITDTTGTVLVEVTGGNVALSGLWAALRAFVDERFISLFNLHTHTYTPGTGTPTVTAAPTVPIVAATCITEKVKGQ